MLALVPKKPDLIDAPPEASGVAGLEPRKHGNDIRKRPGGRPEMEGIHVPVPAISDVSRGASVSGMSQPYLFPAPASAFRSLLDHASKTGKTFTEEEAALDIMLAQDRDDVKPIRYYVKRWNWTRYRVHSGLEDLKEKSARWRSFFRQDQTDSGQAQTRNAVPDTKNGGFQTGSGQDQTDSRQYSTDTDKKNTHTPHARAKKFSPPTVEEVRAYAREKNLLDLAQDFHDHFENTDWRLSGGTGAKMKKWELAYNRWCRTEKKFHPKSVAAKEGVRYQPPNLEDRLY